MSKSNKPLPEPYHAYRNIQLYHGNSKKLLRRFDDNTFGRVLTDPPYELGFMGRKWDSSGIAFDVALWAEVLRVTKPGGFLIAFGGTRTYHRLVCAIEDAGWEIRDMMLWLHASGFPKSLNISKGIDKKLGLKREVIGKEKNRGVTKAEQGKQAFGDYEGEWDITKPASELATLWDGWQTALKPAVEPICIAMKPLDRNFVENAMKHGVAGLNIDECRVGPNPGYKYSADKNGTTFHGQQGERIKQTAEKAGRETIESTKGRWPANVILDGEGASAMLDKQSGFSKSTDALRHCKPKPKSVAKGAEYAKIGRGFVDMGGASRFFFSAKAPGHEREQSDDGTGHATVKPRKLMKYLLKLTSSPDKTIPGLDLFAGSGTALVAAAQLNMPFVGIELEEPHCQIIKKRLLKAKAAKGLFG